MSNNKEVNKLALFNNWKFMEIVQCKIVILKLVT